MGAALMGAALRLCRGDCDRAQDLMQDALVRAYVAFLAGRFRADTDARPWLLRILTNLFINEYHRRRKFESGPDLDMLTSSGEAGSVQTHAAPQDMPGATLLAATLDEEAGADEDARPIARIRPPPGSPPWEMAN